jgi:hypothetical protein
LATPSGLQRTREELGKSRPLDFILPQNIPAKAKKPPFSMEKFWRVASLKTTKILPLTLGCPSGYPSKGTLRGCNLSTRRIHEDLNS